LGRCLIVIACLASSGATPAPPAKGPTVLTAEQWREDLRALASELPVRHRDAFHHISREAFEAACAALAHDVPHLSDTDIVVRLAMLVALVGDGHTRLTLPQDPAIAFIQEHTPTPPPRDARLMFRHLPVRFGWYSRGLFVRTATPEHRDLIGARVLRLGKRTVDEALAAVRPTVSADNEMGVRLFGPVHLAIPEVLHAVGVDDDSGAVLLRVREASGTEREVVLSPLEPGRRVSFIEAAEVAPAPVPLHLQKRATTAWLEKLPARHALYARMARFGDEPGQRLVSFARRMEEALRDRNIDRVVLDLRHNPGGDATLGRSVLRVLLRSRLDRFGHLFVLTGRETFSASQLFINQLEFHGQALFVGEPARASPSEFGDARKFQLPNSGLTVRASTVYWRDWTTDEHRPWTVPHLPVETRASDVFSNKDPVLEAALSFEAPTLPKLLAAVLQRSGVERAEDVLFRWSTEPAHAGERLEPSMVQAGELLLEGGKPADASRWFELTLEQFPDSRQGRAGLSRAREALSACANRPGCR
jgi:hypothetical protein